MSIALEDIKGLKKIALFMNVITVARNWPQEKIWEFISEFIQGNVHSPVIYVANSFKLHLGLSAIWKKFMKVWRSMCVISVDVLLQTNGLWRTTVAFIQERDLLFVICAGRLLRQRHHSMFTTRVTQIFFRLGAHIVTNVSELKHLWHSIFWNILERNHMLVIFVESGLGLSMNLGNTNWFIQMGNPLCVLGVDTPLGSRNTWKITIKLTIKKQKRVVAHWVQHLFQLHEHTRGIKDSYVQVVYPILFTLSIQLKLVAHVCQWFCLPKLEYEWLLD